MTEPRYQFWRPIQPVEGQPIPDGAMFKHFTDKKWQPAYRGERWIGWPADLEWRVPVEAVPIDLAVNLILQNSDPTVEGVSDGQFRVAIARELHVDTLPALRELVVTKLRELSQEKVNEAI